MRFLIILFLCFGWAMAEITISEITETESKKVEFTISDDGLPMIEITSGKDYLITATDLNIEMIKVKNVGTTNINIDFSATKSLDNGNYVALYAVNSFDELWSIGMPGYENYLNEYKLTLKNIGDKIKYSRISISAGAEKIFFIGVKDENGEFSDESVELDEEYKIEFVVTTGSIQADLNIELPTFNNFGASQVLPTILIEKETTIDLSKTFVANDFVCETSDNIKEIALYHYPNENYNAAPQKIDDFKWNLTGTGTTIKFTIPNKENINYRKMHLHVTCDGTKMNATGINKAMEQAFSFDARPAKIVMKSPKLTSSNADILYAQYEYPLNNKTLAKTSLAELVDIKEGENGKSSGSDIITLGYYNDQTNWIHEDSKDFNDNLEFQAVDYKGNIVKSYNASAVIAIVSKIHDKDITNYDRSDNDKKLSCEINGEQCALGYLDFKNGSSKTEGGVYTKKVNQGDESIKVLRYDNVGPTQLYALDDVWTQFSQDYQRFYGDDPENSENSKNSNLKLCVAGSTSNDENNDGLIGCNIAFVESESKDPKNNDSVIDFYSFKPAVFKVNFEFSNSSANDGYGHPFITYMHEIKPEDYSNATNDILEAANIQLSVMAIGASKTHFDSNQTLSYYDGAGNYKKAESIKFDGSLTYNTVEAEYKGDKENDEAKDFPLYMAVPAASEYDLSKIIFIDVTNKYSEPNAALTKLDLEVDRNIDIGGKTMSKANFSRQASSFGAAKGSGGKTIMGTSYSHYKVNFEKPALMPRNYVIFEKSYLTFIDKENKINEWKELKDQNIGVATTFNDNEIVFVDTAMIAPDAVNNTARNNTDAAVYLGGYCTSNCDNMKSYEDGRGPRIPKHWEYYAFAFSPMDVNSTEQAQTYSEASANYGKTRMFDYDGAEWKKRTKEVGADMVNNFTKDKIQVTLIGDYQKEYCDIFRGCRDLGGGKYGVEFKYYGLGETKKGEVKWHGGGEEQGKTIIDERKNRRNDRRLGY